MTDVDHKMLQRMIHLTYNEHTNFSFKDFIDLMKPKTYRNKISKFKKEGIVVLDFKSTIAFHTLAGHHFGKGRTRYHTGDTISHNDRIFQMFKELPKDKQSIHDIRIRFTAAKIYETISNNMSFEKESINKDIRLPFWNINSAIVQIRIHKTDTVSVIIACSDEPFPLDYQGIIAFFTTLARIQGLLIGILLNIHRNKIDQNQSIPDYMKWIITMWHFGRDSLECSKRDFHVAVGKAQHILRYYTKDYGKKKIERYEIQEYPNTSAICAIEDKILP